MRNLTIRPFALAALAGLLALCAARAAAQEEQQEQDVYRLLLPGHQRALEIDLRRFKVNYADLPGEPMAGPNKWSRARLVRVTFMPEEGGRKTPTPFVVRVEEARPDASAQALREATVESLLRHDSVSKDSVRRSAHKEAALLSYTVKGPRFDNWMSLTFTGFSPIPVPNSYGPSSKFPVLEAFQVQAGVWVWIRRELPGGKDDEADAQLLRSLLDAARVVDASRPATSFDYYHLGRTLYQQKEHDAAVGALGRALELERERRQLARPTWRQLVMTLANALGAADDPARAREVLEYGAGEEPANPYFHLGLARLHGFFGDVDAAVASLEKTYEFAPKPAEFFRLSVPDPLTDVAFAKFKDDPKFRDAVKALKKKWKK